MLRLPRRSLSETKIRRRRERGDRLHARVRLGTRAGERHEMATRRITEQRDAIRVAFEFRRVRLHPADRGLQIFIAGRPAVRRREPVGDGEVQVKFSRERRKHRHDVLLAIARHPAAAVDDEHHGKFSIARRNMRVEQQFFAAGFAVLDVEAVRAGRNGSSLRFQSVSRRRAPIPP